MSKEVLDMLRRDMDISDIYRVEDAPNDPVVEKLNPGIHAMTVMANHGLDALLTDLTLHGIQRLDPLNQATILTAIGEQLLHRGHTILELGHESEEKETSPDCDG